MEEHPDVTSARSRGYPSFPCAENRDTVENRMIDLEEHMEELVQWRKREVPDLLEVFLRRESGYDAWLNERRGAGS